MPKDTTYLARRSRFRYGTPGSLTDWTTALPIRPWGRRTPTVGGKLVSAAGVPAAFLIRRDSTLEIPLRFWEYEWEDVDALLAFAQTSESFLWFPDALEPTEFYSVYLESPAAGEVVEPSRSSEHPDLLELTIAIRRVSNGVWTKEWNNPTPLAPDDPVVGLPIYLPSDGSRGEPRTEVAGTYLDIGVEHYQLQGTETLEVWMALLPDAGNPSWFLARSIAATATPTQVVRTGVELQEAEDYGIRLRYRIGTTYNAGAVFGDDGQPAATWPSLSRGTETTSVADPATLDSAVWSRTAADAERVRLTISPADPDADVLVWRRAGVAGSWTLLDTIVGPHGAEETYDDATIDGESTYQYSISTADGARGPALTVWTGPAGIPSYNFDVPFGAGYQVGFSPSDEAYETELEDAYNNEGGVGSFALRATAAAGETEVFSGVLSNVPSPEFTFPARLRHKATAFGVDDFGQYGPEFDVTVPESE